MPGWYMCTVHSPIPSFTAKYMPCDKVQLQWTL
jgi:hypothetical protein